MALHGKSSRDRLLVRADGESGMARRGGGSPRLRGVALALVLLSVSLMGYTIVLLGRPLYWRIYAEVVHRYESDAAAQLIRELQEQKGARARARGRRMRVSSPCMRGMGLVHPVRMPPRRACPSVRAQRGCAA
jgi:hypothetical protein